MPIKVDNVFYTYFKKRPNEVKALKGVSLNIEDKSFLALVGETGSGKSTLVQHLNGLLIPEEGTVTVNEYVITNKKKKNKKMHELRKHIGLIFQFPEYQLFEETVIKDVAFGPKNFGCSQEEALQRSKDALKLVGISESYYERSPFELSGGERRRVAIAGILAIDPDILVLDEPTAGLDYKSSSDIMNLIKTLHEKGKTIILVTHDMDLVYKYASRVCFIKDGNIVFDGTPIDLFKQNDPTLELPKLFRLVLELNNKGMNIPLEKVNSLKDIFKYIKEPSK